MSYLMSRREMYGLQKHAWVVMLPWSSWKEELAHFELTAVFFHLCFNIWGLPVKA